MVAQSVVTCILIIFIQITGQIVDNFQVQDNRAIVNFPETIDFVLTLSTDIPVKRITLIYGTNAASCSHGGARQPQAFDSDTVIEIEWEWDLKRSGSLPPGAEIWWQWEIEDGNGGIFLTDRQSMLVVDDRHSWQEISESNVTVYWYEGDDIFGQSLLTVAVSTVEQLRTEAGITTENPIQLWIYPTGTDVRGAVAKTINWTGGMAFPDHGIALIAIWPGEDEEIAHVIPHEIAHLVEGFVMFNCRGGRMPTWLGEGLAELTAGGPSESSLATLEENLQQGLLPSIKLLGRGFSAYAWEADLAYTQSAVVVRYLLEAYGPEKMADLVDNLRGGKPIDDALLLTYGFDTEGLDANWRLSLGYEPMSTSQVDLAQQLSEPTQVPTLALAGIPVAATTTALPSTRTIATPAVSPTEPVLTIPAAPADATGPVSVIADSNTKPAPATAVPAEPRPVENVGFSYIWPMGGALIVLITLLILFFRQKGGRA